VAVRQPSRAVIPAQARCAQTYDARSAARFVIPAKAGIP
jgi:hypothetical protein